MKQFGICVIRAPGRNHRITELREVIRTNDPVLVSFIEALLNEQEIGHMVLDTNMSIMEGSLGILPRRIMVENESFDQATRILREAGLEQELKPSAGSASGT